ncbi:PREDICTED: zinc finger protein 143-like isoform X2 [Acropora digitifera]|uniref:zinc finger protein 143-like isoform X2 n=1 Tax=Acropora digitifera TaxID=70779 RepID=UPI00077A0ACC|nr:PREDICTED: zinc finger protein 143-like isoform X2 [Acropora digitifera]
MCATSEVAGKHLQNKLGLQSTSGCTQARCHQCDLSFLTKHNYKRHQQRAHDRPFKCPFEGCNVEFMRCNKLKLHQFVHTSEKPFRCTERGCQASFDAPRKLKRHQKRHDEGADQYFPRCRDDRFAHEWLRKHISSHNCALFCEA